MAKNVLNIKDLYVSFDTYAGEVQAVRGVSYHVDEGEVLGVVGESGCGKSVTAQTIMKLNPMPPAKIKSGEITLDGIDIIATSEDKMQEIRGKEVSMIFQDPMTCLNPTMKVGRQITEAIKHHQKLSKEEAEKDQLKC
ncbi:ATP-binding cassette domain-containing protein [Coprobacillaceae bacterium CR2/5/TPMF4]|nr:ATP-binding cassette domain-containing protein [Coprobacillaceae bacterium CR2/5/TPMF4]